MTDVFTLDAYKVYLRLAKDLGYSFGLFPDWLSGSDPSELTLLIRHDIDYSAAHVPAMSAAENEHGARSTYCLQTDSPYYSYSAVETKEAVRSLLEDGHSLGLHFDATQIPVDAQVVDLVTVASEKLEYEFGCRIEAVSFHMPGRRPVGNLILAPGLINTYAPIFFDQLQYVSDSNQNWRGADLQKILTAKSGRAIQLLIHPIWWQSRPGGMLTRLRALADEIGTPVEAILTDGQRQLLTSHEADSVGRT